MMKKYNTKIDNITALHIMRLSNQMLKVNKHLKNDMEFLVSGLSFSKKKDGKNRAWGRKYKPFLLSKRRMRPRIF